MQHPCSFSYTCPCYHFFLVYLLADKCLEVLNPSNMVNENVQLLDSSLLVHVLPEFEHCARVWHSVVILSSYTPVYLTPHLSQNSLSLLEFHVSLPCPSCRVVVVFRMFAYCYGNNLQLCCSAARWIYM